MAVLEGWIAAGAPPGTCGAIAGGPAPTTCASGSTWNDGDLGSAEMQPGLACTACHLQRAHNRARFFAGTVFSGYHERDGCNSPPPAGARIDIIDAHGDLALTLYPNRAGNFQSTELQPGVDLPYRARVVAGGLARSMRTAQT